MAENNNTGLVALKSALSADSVKEQFQRMLGNKSAGFISNIISVAQSNTMFNNVDRNSIILAAAQAASLDLSINPNLGLAALIPYGGQCQFQLQRDGWMELCLRTGQFKSIVNEPVYEGELVEHNRFTDTYVFDETKRVSDKLIGVMASFELTNGYKKVLYMSVEECKEHGKKYSKTFNNPKGLWTSNFLAMSLKTVLKKLLKKYAPKSIEVLNRANEVDQAAFTGTIDNPQPVYVDNPNNAPRPEEVKDFQEAEVVEQQPTDAETARNADGTLFDENK
jgi:recombination protein RecT